MANIVNLGAHFIRAIGLLSLAEALEARRSDVLRILVYHRIGDVQSEDNRLDPTLLSASPAQFAEQMRYLGEHYQPLSIADLLGHLDNSQPLPPRSVMVTFDDGYSDFIDTAWPVLERFAIPALMFLPTGYLAPENQLFWWDKLYQGITRTSSTRLTLPQTGSLSLASAQERWQAFVTLKNRICCLENGAALQLVERILQELDVRADGAGILMNWQKARVLQEHGCYLAAHTRSHAILSRLTPEHARSEIHASLQDIKRELGTVWPVLAYPSGHTADCCDSLAGVMRDEGLRLVLSSIPGYNALQRCDLHKLKRIPTSPALDMSAYRLTLTSIFNLYSKLKVRVLHHD